MKRLMLLHDQNDGWAVPYPYLVVCWKNIYLRMLFKEAYIAWYKLLYDFRTVLLKDFSLN
jgi:hypothetical protein